MAALALLVACEASPRPDDARDAELADSDVEPLPGNLAPRVASYLTQYGRHWPAFRFHGAVAVARGEQLAVDQAFGDADLIAGTPNDTTTLFRIGTLSAQLTAAAVMRLVEAERLQLTDPVSRHLPGWPAGDETTIEHLLAHRSGIPSYTDDQSFEAWKKGPRTIDDTLALFRGHPLEFSPGTDTAPSNSNYVLLGAILEEVTGMPYEDVVTEQVLEPLGMRHTHYATSDEAQAIGMTYNEDEFLEVVNDVHPAAFGPAGGWLSTTGDLLQWVRGLGRGDLLTERHAKLMMGLLDDGLGYGWVVSEVGGRTVSTWPGLIDGFNASLLYVPEDDTTIIVLSNSEVIPAGQLVHDIATILYDDEVPRREEAQAAPVAMTDQAIAEGRYVLTRGTEEALASADPDAVAKLDEVFVRRQDDHLVFEVPGHGRKHMHPLSRGRFFFKDGAQTEAEVLVRADRPNVLVLEAGAVEVRFVRVAEEG